MHFFFLIKTASDVPVFESYVFKNTDFSDSKVKEALRVFFLIRILIFIYFHFSLLLIILKGLR